MLRCHERSRGVHPQREILGRTERRIPLKPPQIMIEQKYIHTTKDHFLPSYRNVFFGCGDFLYKLLLVMTLIDRRYWLCNNIVWISSTILQIPVRWPAHWNASRTSRKSYTQLKCFRKADAPRGNNFSCNNAKHKFASFRNTNKKPHEHRAHQNTAKIH